MKDWYQKDEQEILKELNVTKEGLTAGQAEQLLLEKGENVLKEGKKKSVLAVAVLCPSRCHLPCSGRHFHVFRECGEYDCHCGRHHSERDFRDCSA